MEPKIVVLKLFLQELDIPLSISSIDERMFIQKAVYLGQRAGADLNYRFRWYLKGPYCSDLTKDYYELTEIADASTQSEPEYKLRAEYSDALASIKNLLTVPKDVNLSSANWVELLASLDYALTVQKLTEQKAMDFVAHEKSHLAGNISRGIQSLKASPLSC